MHLPPCHLLELTFLNLVLTHLEFITQLIDTSCPILIISNIDPLLYKHVEAFSDIHLVIEAIICEGKRQWGISCMICRELSGGYIHSYLYIKISKTQINIPHLHFTTFSQVLSFLHTDLFGITKYHSGNQYLVTKLVPLSLGFTKFILDRNIIVKFTPA